MSLIVRKILALYEEIEAINARAGRGEYVDPIERARVVALQHTIAKLWNARRAEQAGCTVAAQITAALEETRQRKGLASLARRTRA